MTALMLMVIGSSIIIDYINIDLFGMFAVFLVNMFSKILVKDISYALLNITEADVISYEILSAWP